MLGKRVPTKLKLNGLFLACNNFVRYITAGVGSLVAADIQRVVMPGILYTVCGASLFLMAGTLVIVRRKGHEWSLNHGCDTSG